MLPFGRPFTVMAIPPSWRCLAEHGACSEQGLGCELHAFPAKLGCTVREQSPSSLFIHGFRKRSSPNALELATAVPDMFLFYLFGVCCELLPGSTLFVVVNLFLL